MLQKSYTTAAIVNRSFSEGATEILDKVDQGLSLEGGELDYKGSTAAVNGAFDQLTTNQRFERLVILDSIPVKNGGMGIFPSQLDWDEVARICNENDVQLLFSLELYDTDTRISYSSKTVTKSTPLGNVPLLQHTANMTTTIKTGWRIYDPANKLVLDQFIINDALSSTGTGINPVIAAAALINRGQAVKQISTEVGRFYAGRIQPQSFRVWRDYFNKGSRNLKIAKRRSEVNDWKGAAELWEKDTKSTKRKVAGRASYNMAIYSEIDGDIYKALEWAQKAYSDYRIKQGLVYADILRDRIARREAAERLDALED
jgi:hypothetical protein